MAHHLLTTYLKSYIAVIKSQFSTKAFQGGREVRTRALGAGRAVQAMSARGYTLRLLQPQRARGPEVGQGHGSFLNTNLARGIRL